MGRPKINPDDKRNKAVSVYLTQELKDAFTEKINSDTKLNQTDKFGLTLFRLRCRDFYE